MRKTKAEKGITLVALIITIIVLLILAVVSINAVQNDGIIDYAKNARTEYEKAQDEEQALLDYYTSQIQSSTGKGIVHNGIIPQNASYTPAGGTVILSGNNFPTTVKDGDTYQYGDYEYCYNSWYKMSTSTWVEDKTINGWGVRLLDQDRDSTEYGEILTTINSKKFEQDKHEMIKMYNYSFDIKNN